MRWFRARKPVPQPHMPAGRTVEATPALTLAGNREMHARYEEFSERLKAVRAEHPLKSPNGYYPYGTIHAVRQILPLLDKHGIDLKASVEGSAVLDLGCGDGELSFFVELFQPARVLAIDAAAYNRNGMEACYVLKESLASGVEFVNADVHTLDIRQLGPFDITFCFGFLYHSPHPQWVLENLARCTGALLLTTRIFDNDGSYAYFYDVGESNNDPTNWWCFTTRALELMLKRAGFRLSFVERLDSHVGKSDPVDPALDGRAFVYATV